MSQKAPRWRLVSEIFGICYRLTERPVETILFALAMLHGLLGNFGTGAFVMMFLVLAIVLEIRGNMNAHRKKVEWIDE